MVLVNSLFLTALLFAISCTSLWTHSSDSLFPPLLEAEISDLTHGLSSGHFTSVQLVRAYISRIAEINHTVHAVTELNPDAVTIASELDSLRSSGTILGPLHGIPVLIKNNIATNDQMNTTAGSYALLGSRVSVDSTMASKLREAGAIILGKVNLSQWANFRSANSSNGWSALGGQTYGAYYPGQDPSGSSSGSGVACSLGLAAATLGTETAGSILAPSEMNNLVGIKPTVGLTSRAGVIPISEHQDTIGPMARTVRDAAVLLQAVAGRDERDNYTLASPFGDDLPAYTAACEHDALRGKRIGVAWNVIDALSPIGQPVLDAFEDAIEVIRMAGATIVNTSFTGIDDWKKDSNMSVVMEVDFATGLERYFSQLAHNPNSVENLQDMLHFTHSNPIEQWPFYDTMLWESALKQGFNNTSAEFWAAYQTNLYYGGEAGVLGALERSNLDAIILPTMVSSPIPALVGSPVITVPMGVFPEDWPVSLNRRGELIASGPNFPIGLAFLGVKWSEADLIGYAYAYEQRTMHRYDPKLYVQPSTEIRHVVDDSELLLRGREETEKRMCSREFANRCEMFEDWPRIMKAVGTPTQSSWWSRYLEDAIQATDKESVVAPNPAMEEM